MLRPVVARATHAAWRRRHDVLLIAAYAILAMGVGYCQGQDANWDLLSYHYHNAYMWLDGRIARDVHVAGVQSFFNPPRPSVSNPSTHV